MIRDAFLHTLTPSPFVEQKRLRHQRKGRSAGADHGRRSACAGSRAGNGIIVTIGGEDGLTETLVPSDLPSVALQIEKSLDGVV